MRSVLKNLPWLLMQIVFHGGSNGMGFLDETTDGKGSVMEITAEQVLMGMRSISL